MNVRIFPLEPFIVIYFSPHQFHGKGVYTYKNGTKFEGEWEKGVRLGDFTLYLPAMKKVKKHIYVRYHKHVTERKERKREAELYLLFFCILPG